MKKYNWNAKDYETHSQAQQQWARELIAKLNLTGDEVVLDVGCGDGKVTAEIARLTPNGSVIGIDNSSAMIELARERHPPRENPSISFEVMDAVELSYVEQFDVVFSNAALHWVRDHRPVVAGLYRSLKPGGRILLQMGGKGNAERIIAVLGALQATDEWRPYFGGFEFPYGFLGTEEYTRLLHDVGFTIHRVELIPKDMAHDGQTGLEGWIRTTWLPYLERVPEDRRIDFIRALSTQYIDQFPLDSDGKAHVAMVRLEVEAQKPA